MGWGSTSVSLAHRFLLVGGFAPTLIINLMDNRLRVPVLSNGL